LNGARQQRVAKSVYGLEITTRATKRRQTILKKVLTSEAWKRIIEGSTRCGSRVEKKEKTAEVLGAFCLEAFENTG
jgi:hypothetical protein